MVLSKFIQSPNDFFPAGQHGTRVSYGVKNTFIDSIVFNDLTKTLRRKRSAPGRLEGLAQQPTHDVFQNRLPPEATCIQARNIQLQGQVVERAGKNSVEDMNDEEQQQQAPVVDVLEDDPADDPLGRAIQALTTDQECCNALIKEHLLKDFNEMLDVWGLVGLEWMIPFAPTLAKATKQASKVVQELIVRMGDQAKARLMDELITHATKLCESKHGHWVLKQIIPVALSKFPSKALAIIDELEKMEKKMENGTVKGALAVAQHEFGYRVFEYLLPFGPKYRMDIWVEQCIQKAVALSMDYFGKNVMQSMLEYGGSSERRSKIFEKLLPNLTKLSGHKNARHVVKKLLENSGSETRLEIFGKLLPDLPELSRDAKAIDVVKALGSCVVEELKTVGLGEENRKRFEEAFHILKALGMASADEGGSC